MPLKLWGCSVQPLVKVKAIIVHHTAGDLGGRNEREYFEHIERCHVEERGWQAIGYHWLVFPSGVTEPGRPECLQGAHARRDGWNARSLGVAFVGALHEHPPTPAQIARGADLIARLVMEHGLHLEDVLGHQETGAATLCPGRYLPMWMLRGKVREAIRCLVVACLHGRESIAPRE